MCWMDVDTPMNADHCAHEAGDEAEIVGDEDDSEMAVEFAQEIEEILFHLLIEVCSRLIKEQEFGFGDKRAREKNALMVNSLQRCSSTVVQNSLREGFGLTVTEAMWKQCSVVGSRACGIRQQIRAGVDGHLIDDCEDPVEIASLLDETLDDLPGRVRHGQSAQRRVHTDFLVFTQVRRWLEALADQVAR